MKPGLFSSQMGAVHGINGERDGAMGPVNEWPSFKFVLSRPW